MVHRPGLLGDGLDVRALIRRLTDPKHIPKLIEYARQWHAKSALKGIAIDTAKSAALLRSAMMDPNGAIWASFDKDKKIHGILIGMVIDWPYLAGRYGTDLLFIADRDGLQLYRAFTQWAKARKVNSLQMGVSSGLPQAGAFFERMGLQNVGGIYFSEVIQ